MYLLGSQATTLVTHIFTAIIAVFWFFWKSSSFPLVGLQYIGAFLIGMLFVSLFRALLLPFQIAELHKFSLDVMLAEKEKAIKERINEASSKKESSGNPPVVRTG
jgi:hypothetical protein